MTRSRSTTPCGVSIISHTSAGKLSDELSAAHELLQVPLTVMLYRTCRFYANEGTVYCGNHLGLYDSSVAEERATCPFNASQYAFHLSAACCRSRLLSAFSAVALVFESTQFCPCSIVWKTLLADHLDKCPTKLQQMTRQVSQKSAKHDLPPRWRTCRAGCICSGIKLLNCSTGRTLAQAKVQCWHAKRKQLAISRPHLADM